MGVTLALFLAAAGALGGIPDARVGASGLPLLGRIGEAGQTRVEIRGRLPPSRRRSALRVARIVHRDVIRRFGGARPPVDEQPVLLCLFATAAGYDRFVAANFGPGPHSPMGFYLPSRRVVVANLQGGNGNLRHELAHAVLGDGFPSIPGWLNEGVGSLYGSARIERGRMHFLINYRLRSVHAAQAKGTLPSLAALSRAGRAQVYGEDAGTYYGLSRYLLLYLERQGKLSAVYRELRDEADDTAVLARHVDEATFGRWVSRLRYPPRS